MILKGFKEKSNKKLIQKHLNDRVLQQHIKPMQTVGIIFSVDEIQDCNSLRTLLKRFKSLTSVTGIAFTNEKKIAQNSFSPCFNNKAFNWKGVPVDTELNTFIDTPFDVLINYYKTESSYVASIAAASKAKFKVGLDSAYDVVNDLIIAQGTNDDKAFVSELEKYLTILNKL